MTEDAADSPELGDPVYTAAQVAAILKIRLETCYQLVRDGHLRAVRVNTRNIQISRAELDRFINSGGVRNGGSDT